MFSSLRNYNYRLFYSGQVISLTGTWMQMVGLAWLVLNLTKSSVALGTVTMLQFLPILLFALVGGVVADRVNKRKFLQFTQVVGLVQAMTLAVLVSKNVITLPEIYVLASIQGLNAAFDNPTRQAFVVEMVGREDLANAVALNSGLFNAARIVGPGIGGLIIESHLGIAGTFYANALSYIPSLIALALMKKELFHARPAPRGGNILENIREGLRYAFSEPRIKLITVMMAVIGTFGYNFSVSLPLLARFALNRGATAFGTLTAAMGLGSLVAAVYLARQARITHRMLIVGTAAFTLFLALVAVPFNYYITCGLLVCAGFASLLFNASGNTLIQMDTPDHLRGRVMSIFFLLLAGSTPIGGYFTGLLTHYIQIRHTLAIE
ncbi:MAG: MFS transporter, partial [Armatimonadota bacterium]|nr:MFS transporter [Armatimonadota bacterium]